MDATSAEAAEGGRVSGLEDHPAESGEGEPGRNVPEGGRYEDISQSALDILEERGVKEALEKAAKEQLEEVGLWEDLKRGELKSSGGTLTAEEVESRLAGEYAGKEFFQSERGIQRLTKQDPELAVEIENTFLEMAERTQDPAQKAELLEKVGEFDRAIGEIESNILTEATPQTQGISYPDANDLFSEETTPSGTETFEVKKYERPENIEDAEWQSRLHQAESAKTELEKTAILYQVNQEGYTKVKDFANWLEMDIVFDGSLKDKKGKISPEKGELHLNPSLTGLDGIKEGLKTAILEDMKSCIDKAYQGKGYQFESLDNEKLSQYNEISYSELLKDLKGLDNEPLENGPYIKNGKATGRMTLSGKARLRFEQYVYVDFVNDKGILADAHTGDRINWRPGQSRDGVIDFGHKKGKEYRKFFPGYQYGDLSLNDLRNFQFDPKNFQPEKPSNNRGHQYEQR